MSVSPLDLTTLANVKQWLSASGIPPSNTSDDADIQACITAFSVMFLQRTNEFNQDNTEPTQSVFLTQVQFSEVYDGNNSFRMFLRHSPIQSISSLIIGNWQPAPSTAYGIAGYVIDASKKSISLRGGGGIINFATLWGSGVGGFWEGIQNVAVTYIAGYKVGAIASSALVNGGNGYNNGDTFSVNGGNASALATGTVTGQTAGVVTGYNLTSVGQGYSPTSSVATTAITGSGSGLTLSLSVLPNDDIELAARKSVALNYTRKGWIGRKSDAMAQGAGTTSYGDWELDKDTERLIAIYTNWSVV